MKNAWAYSTWLFIHVLLLHIKNKYYQEHNASVLQLVKDICTNVPCSTCAKHSVKKVLDLSYTKYDTIDKVRQFFYDFHNSFSKIKNSKHMYLKYDLFYVFKTFTQIYPKKYSDTTSIEYKKRVILIQKIETFIKKMY